MLALYEIFTNKILVELVQMGFENPPETQTEEITKKVENLLLLMKLEYRVFLKFYDDSGLKKIVA